MTKYRYWASKASRFCSGGSGAAGNRSNEMSMGPWSKIRAQGNNLRLRDEGGRRGRSSTHDQKSLDSQHMLNQPRGFFPDVLKLHICNHFTTYGKVRHFQPPKFQCFSHNVGFMVCALEKNLCCASRFCSGGRGAAGRCRPCMSRLYADILSN